MRWLRALIFALTLAQAAPAFAVQPDEVLGDPALEARARALSKELRCMVCQNQSIDDSDAPLARDLRILVRERLKEGDSDADVIRFLTGRYGDFVLLRPPFNWRTFLLWFGPLLLLVAGVASVIRAARRRNPPPDSKLSAAEEARLAALREQAREGR